MFILPFFINLSACEYLSPDALIFFSATSEANSAILQSFLKRRQVTLDLSEMRIDWGEFVQCLTVPGGHSLLPLFREMVITDQQKSALIQAQSSSLIKHN
jgi:hypothetical protein